MNVRLVNEIKTMGRFLESRQKMGYVGDLAERLAEAMTRSVADLPCLDAEAAARLTDAVEQSAYLQAGKDMITNAIDAKLMQDDPMGSAPAKGHISKQASSRRVFWSRRQLSYTVLVARHWELLHRR